MPGAQYLVHGSQYPIPTNWCPVLPHSDWCAVTSTQCLLPGTLYLPSNARYWCLLPGGHLLVLEPFIPFHLHQYLVLEPCTHYPLPALRPCNWCTVHCAGALYLVPSAKAMYLVLVPCTQCCCPVPQCLCPIPGTGALYLVPSAKALYPVQVSCSLSQGRGTGAPYPTPGTGANAGARRPVLLPCTAAPRPARSARCRCPVYSVWCRCPVPGAYTGNGCQRWLLMPVPRCRFQCRCPGRVCSSRSRWTVHGAGC